MCKAAIGQRGEPTQNLLKDMKPQIQEALGFKARQIKDVHIPSEVKSEKSYHFRDPAIVFTADFSQGVVDA